MSGIHGLTSAPGARSAVLSVPVRRALLLVGLVAGILVAAWLAAAVPAQAGENPSAAANSAADRSERAAGAGGSQGRAPEVPPGLDKPVADTVSTVVDQAAKPVQAAQGNSGSTPAAVVSEAATRGSEVSQSVHESVGDVSEEAVGHGQGHGSGSGHGRPDDTAPEPEGTEDEDVVEDEAVVDVDAEFAPVEDLAFPEAAEASVEEAEADESAVDSDTPAATADGSVVSPLSSVTGSSSGSSAPASAVGGMVADHPFTIGASAPQPGLSQAAWHVLRSVPAEDADEPTFSPD
ncbi:hypothetical protein DFP74_2475 [Nocardiopsis sp. Huas11]|uniref:hypothetical protein n=1 Tax=Nocardiopsis sp. Huas11 TaxID=2183912 RepID=UPI000EAE2248|nr:hypothetical protein [Nocardiopsis sp. Huas11]RKS06826.1 hypothetical protein DFP74_2475 [Nocardiopsis sp. Huas11]